MVEFVLANLLMFLIAFGVMGVLFIISVFGIFFLMKKMWFVADQTAMLLELIDDYKGHLNDLHQPDKYFGEPSIMNLIEHSRFLAENLGEFLDAFEFMQVNTTEEIDEDNDEEEDYEEDNEEESS